MSDSYVPPALFVTWQDPVSRTIFPVGRLVRIVAPRAKYEFAYLRAARNAEEKGFVPFVAFPDLTEVYRSSELPPFFQNRLMPRNRTEYAAQLTAIGLDASASEEEVLARTNGRRATDLYELFGEFEPGSSHDEWETRFFARSIRYLDFPQTIDALTPGQTLFCMRDVQNPVDVAAIALRNSGNAIVGYCPAYLVDDLEPLLAHPGSVAVTVERVNAPPTPLQLRLQCHLRVRTPAGFHGYRTGRFEPLASGAIRLTPWARTAKVA
jgi:hypothetical protein